jgi:hypothetical protein
MHNETQGDSICNLASAVQKQLKSAKKFSGLQRDAEKTGTTFKVYSAFCLSL